MKKSCFNFLLSPDGVEGAPVTDQAPNMPATSPAEAPPAATVVVNGEMTEEVVKLRKKNTELETDKRKVEIEASNLRDENNRLKQAGVTPAAVPIVDKRSAIEKFMQTGEVD